MKSEEECKYTLVLTEPELDVISHALANYGEALGVYSLMNEGDMRKQQECAEAFAIVFGLGAKIKAEAGNDLPKPENKKSPANLC
jgi:hypothetical protein